ncbi:MAG: hypothetical protein ACYDAS_01305 [Patescibacteria group bacterium]
MYPLSFSDVKVKSFKGGTPEEVSNQMQKFLLNDDKKDNLVLQIKVFDIMEMVGGFRQTQGIVIYGKK